MRTLFWVVAAVVFTWVAVSVLVIYPKVDAKIGISFAEFWQTSFQILFIPLSIVIAAGAYRQSAMANQLSARVASAQMRPWVGLRGAAFTPGGGTGLGAVTDTLEVSYENFGTLPAERLGMTVTVRPVEADEHEPAPGESLDAGDGEPGGSDALIELTLPSIVTVFPREPSWQKFEIISNRFALWRSGGRDVVLHGQFRYESAEEQHITRFEVTLPFSKRADADVPLTWRNLDAS